MSATLIKNVPTHYECEEWDEDDSYPQGGTWITVESVYRMAGQVTFPADGGKRDSKIIFGLFESGQMVGKGIKMNENNGGDNYAAGVSISLAAYALAERHARYREWLAKDRQVVSVDLNLDLKDIADFRFWHAVMIRSRKFIVKRLTLRLSARRDGILSSAELISL